MPVDVDILCSQPHPVTVAKGQPVDMKTGHGVAADAFHRECLSTDLASVDLGAEQPAAGTRPDSKAQPAKQKGQSGQKDRGPQRDARYECACGHAQKACPRLK